MNPRRALMVVIVVGATALLWAGARYRREVGPEASPSPSVSPAGEAIALRFFKNPGTVPDFTVQDLDGRTISLSSLRGRVTVINFWATWCGPCRAEIPDLVVLQEKYRDTLQIVGISEDEASPEIVKRFAADHHVNYPIVMVTPELRKVFPGVSALPTSFVLDRESRVVQKHVGLLRRDTTEAEARLLAGLPVNATVEHVDQAQGLKLENGAQATSIPGVDLAKLSVERRTEALQKLNSQPCTCGCDLTIARCRVDDPACGVSLPIARQIVLQVAAQK
jgi:thiol-disulfide isomerase/thioredoxin